MEDVEAGDGPVRVVVSIMGIDYFGYLTDDFSRVRSQRKSAADLGNENGPADSVTTGAVDCQLSTVDCSAAANGPNCWIPVSQHFEVLALLIRREMLTGQNPFNCWLAPSSWIKLIGAFRLDSTQS